MDNRIENSAVDENLSGPVLREKKNIMFIMVVVLLAVVVFVVAVVVVYSNMPEQRVSRQISLGERYLSELRYEEAVAAFGSAIEIDPQNEEAKGGLVEAYIAWAEDMFNAGDIDRALEILKEGNSIVESGKLASRIAEYEALIAQPSEDIIDVAESEEPPHEKDDEMADRERFHKAYDDILEVESYEILGRSIADWDFESLYGYIRENGESQGDTGTDIVSYSIDGHFADVHVADEIIEVVLNNDEGRGYYQVQSNWFKNMVSYRDQQSATYPILGQKLDNYLQQFNISMDDVASIAGKENQFIGSRDWSIGFLPRDENYLITAYDKRTGNEIMLVTNDNTIGGFSIQSN